MIPMTLLSVGCFIGQPPLSPAEASLREYMTHVSELAAREGPIPLDSNGSSAFARQICKSQNLTEQGKYADAAGILSDLLLEKLASDWTRMLQTRIAILAKWEKSDRIDLKDYATFYLETGPFWFQQRATPIAKLWKMEEGPPLEKYLLVVALLDKKRDFEGQVKVLEAIPDLPGVADEAAVQALVRAGSARLILNDAAGAEKNWSRVRKDYRVSPQWSMAVLALAQRSQKNKEYAKAIEVFKTLLDPDLKWTGGPMRGNFRYYAALGTADCYEALEDHSSALKYAELARDKFVFASGCGTCNEGQQQRLSQRIEHLKRAAAGLPPLEEKTAGTQGRPLRPGLVFLVGLALVYAMAVVLWLRRANLHFTRI